MGRLKSKGKAGAAKAYITRTAAVKKLQCSLADFRRLCILKGIYPREPRSRKKANKGNSAPTSFYYAKDIAYLQHEPVLRKLREHKAFAKKLSRALGRGEWSIAKGLEERKPVYKLDHIIKERYPTFIDALRDIDDALCLVALFGTVPSNERVSPSLVENCSRLYNEWQLYVINTRSLRKVFLSIKGIYYQAVVQGETVTWIVPWMFTQTIPADVDARVMLTFLELYQTLLGFVFFKLYSDEGWVYPPPLDSSKEEKGAGLGALSVVDKNMTAKPIGSIQQDSDTQSRTVSGKDVRKIIKDISSSTEPIASGQRDTEMAADIAEDIEEEFVPQTSKTDPTAANTSSLPTYQSISAAAGTMGGSTKLFEGLSFWLSRETPRHLLEFAIRSFGGKAGWDPTVGDGSPYDEHWDGITHVIIDRPAVAPPQNDQGSSIQPARIEEDDLKRRKRKYIQPQWVVDCINAGRILSEDKYERGRVLPPHLSPFGEDQGAYQPDVEEGGVDGNGDAIMKGSEKEETESEEEVIEGADLPDEEDEESEVEQDVIPPTLKSDKKEKALKKARKGVDAEALRAAELEAEAAGVDYMEFERAKKQATKQNKGAKGVVSQEETIRATEQDMNKMMMSNRQRKLYEKMKYSERKKTEEKTKLEQRKAAIQKTKRREAKQLSNKP
ncbi:mRNA-binding ribosome synthesis protein nop7 [Serendipita sp. 398]|nr:mRNA-binding ribosome synthesis protein nop7 [Serendipita sp. 398]KAG8835658.1 mRNA-binding ribosome synthesis protein nop7 [Serendipita sp. 400]